MSNKTLAVKQENAVWIIDDDVLIARVLSHWLMQRGFEVEIIKNGRDAIETMAVSRPPKLVLLDIMMPFADGFEVLSRLRSTRSWKKVPVIMLTSKSSEASVVQAFEGGADDYVTKPFKLPELMARMNRLMK
ncbi:MAG: response regulator [Acidobacteria bacterium]|nr:response regulator [Acidobacteriota bacterium]